MRGLVLLPLLVACQPGSFTSHTRSFTSTVAVSGEAGVLLETWASLEVIGEPLRREVRVEVEATITASTSTAARRIAEALDLEVSRDARTVAIRLAPPRDGTLGGVVRVRMPSRLALDARVQAGIADVRGVEAPTQIAAADGAVAVGQGELAVLATRGDVAVDATPEAGKTIRAETGRGNVVLRLPPALSAAVEADVGQSGEVAIQHPALPQAAGINRTRYRASVNGGLSLVRALTQSGRILIGVRQ